MLHDIVVHRVIYQSAQAEDMAVMDTVVMVMVVHGVIAAVGGNHLIAIHIYKDPRFQAGIFFGTISGKKTNIQP